MKKTNYLFQEEEDSSIQNGFQVIADFEGEAEDLMTMEVGENVAILPLRNMVLFPGVLMPVTIGRRSSARLVRDAQKHNQLIGVVCQKKADVEYPNLEDLHEIGTIGKIVRILEMPDHTSTVIIQGAQRFKLLDITETDPYMRGRIEEIPDPNLQREGDHRISRSYQGTDRSLHKGIRLHAQRCTVRTEQHT